MLYRILSIVNCFPWMFVKIWSILIELHTSKHCMRLSYKVNLTYGAWKKDGLAFFRWIVNSVKCVLNGVFPQFISFFSGSRKWQREGEGRDDRQLRQRQEVEGQASAKVVGVGVDARRDSDAQSHQRCECSRLELNYTQSRAVEDV